MNEDAKVFIGFIFAVIILATSIIWSTSWYYTTTTKAAIEAGYEQQTLQGQSGVYWVKTSK